MLVMGLGARRPDGSVGHGAYVTASGTDGGKLKQGTEDIMDTFFLAELSKWVFLLSFCALSPKQLQTCNCQSFCSLKVQPLIRAGS